MCEEDGMEEWKECKLSEIMDLIGGGTPKTSNPDYWDGDIPWISVKDFNGERRYVGDTEKKITKLGLENSSTKILSKGDIIISARGTVGELAIIPSDMAFNQSCYGLRAKDFVDSCFLYYLLKQSVNILKHNTHGSVFDTITRETFENISVKLPPLPTQQKIAAILSSLDDKIELNNKINTNLEQQAQALFKNWFVDFEPFGGKMPEGWKVGKLSDISILSAGGDKPKEVSDKITEDYKVPIYSNGLDNFGLYGYTNKAKIFEESVTVSARGTIGFVCLRMVPYVPIVRLISLIPKTDFISAKYLYLHLLNCNITGTGTTQQQLTVPAFSKEQIIIPSKNAIDSFTNTVNPFFETIVHNRKENEKISSMRDTLLPKLMNGEIKVDEVRK